MSPDTTADLRPQGLPGYAQCAPPRQLDTLFLFPNIRQSIVSQSFFPPGPTMIAFNNGAKLGAKIRNSDLILAKIIRFGIQRAVKDRPHYHSMVGPAASSLLTSLPWCLFILTGYDLPLGAHDTSTSISDVNETPSATGLPTDHRR